MTTHPQIPAPLGPVVASAAAVLNPDELAAKAQAKAVKKERKHARLRSFAAWCWGCQSMGGSF
ncbi:hypothetical protein ACFQ48_20625 [Hymenobacter caeli]|uniref:Uncharacterized protein n=1 Tax=Hymenobacter caeli TaxID=2735894 RepID=A0ABX2FVY0_9BACT|nr:hypothetical protein [Hymenobacter caeli]NRT21372.1 hypothetical protein [Hymenobacter caeli]